MATISITPGALTNYRGTTAQSDDTIYVGWNGTAHYRLKLKITVSKRLKKLNATIGMRANSGNSQGTGTFRAALTQTSSTSPPTAEASFKFDADTNRKGSFTITKKLAKGTWYLWVWQTFTDHTEILSGAAVSYPTWVITGETAGAGHVYRSGTWADATPYVYRNGAWTEVVPEKYNSIWEELS